MKKKTFVQERNGDLLPDEGLLVYYSARNLPCIRREAPGEVPVGVRVLNSYVSSCAIHQNGENQIEYI